jgi:hypothetical protein
MKTPSRSLFGQAVMICVGVEAIAIGFLLFSSFNQMQWAQEIIRPSAHVENARGNVATPEWTRDQYLKFVEFHRQKIAPTWIVKIAMPILVIFYLAWLYRSHWKLKRLDTVNLQFKTFWIFGYHIVPFVNLVQPYGIMREIWHGSDPRAAAPNDCGPGHVRSSWLVRAWWALTVGSAVAAYYAFIRGHLEFSSWTNSQGLLQLAKVTLPAMEASEVSLIVLVVARLLLAWLVWSVDGRQMKRAALLSTGQVAVMDA